VGYIIERGMMRLLLLIDYRLWSVRTCARPSSLVFNRLSGIRDRLNLLPGSWRFMFAPQDAFVVTRSLEAVSRQ
jgi:hypothetical protein